jgi:hypothetical protein
MRRRMTEIAFAALAISAYRLCVVGSIRNQEGMRIGWQHSKPRLPPQLYAVSPILSATGLKPGRLGWALTPRARRPADGKGHKLPSGGGRKDGI